MNVRHDARTLERTYELARQIADEAASSWVWSYCGYVHGEWLCPPSGPGKAARHVARALEYLALRGLIEYDSTGKLVRFVEGGE